MTTWRRLTVSFLIALAIWAFFSWPIPRLLTEGVASASLNVEKGNARAMLPGDHLQLLYQFWLTGDTLRGNTPAFVNPYEFNVGNDADGAFRGTYYVPFSLFYAAGAAVGGRAFGYNFAQFVTMWITLLFMWLLVRRYSRDDGISAAAAVIGMALPYPWITMFDGSPTGLAMMWVPVVVWAADIMVAERKLWAGAVAGIGVCLAEADSHVFFFILLSLPAWCLLSYLFHFPGRKLSRREIGSLLKAASLLILLLGVAVWEVWAIRHSIQETTLATTSRSMEEVRANSAPPGGIVKPTNIGEGRKIYVGAYLSVLLGLGFWALWRVRRRAQNKAGIPLLPILLIGAGVVGAAWLATGVMNPLGPRAWKAVTMLIPPYGMIRQPHKIYCLMPVLLVVAAGMVWPYLFQGLSPRVRRGLLLAVAIPLVLEYGMRVKVTVCLLDREQGAFRAIAEDAKAEGNPRPHLLSLPLWPGDSHYDSLNEYYVSLYGLRMVNGYGGAVKPSYLNTIVMPLEGLNVGGVADGQLDALLKRGVGYLVLHEDCFPEKVSPFPVGRTLQALLNAPRLACLAQDGAIWSFKILPAGRPALPSSEHQSFMTINCPARRLEFETLVPSNTVDFIALSGKDQSVSLPPSLVLMDISPVWGIRARGQGRVAVANIINGITNAPSVLAVDSKAWTWMKGAIPGGAGVSPLSARFEWADGSVDLDTVLLMAGDWSGPAPGKSAEFPAASFFHAGYTDRTNGSVTMRARVEPDSIVFYGPKLPLEPGRYSAELVFDSPAPVATMLGQFNIRWEGDENSGWVPVKAGAQAVASFIQKDNLPFFVAFRFLRNADIRIRAVVLTRTE